VSVLVNKELFAALGAAKTLVDYSRRIKGLVDAAAFESLRRQTFSPQEHALIMDLRNSVLHEVHSEANWQKVYRGGPATTHFVIDREELLTDGDLSSTARAHLLTLGEKVDITDLLSAYSQKVEAFYGWFLPELESKLPLAVADYRACRQDVKSQHGRLSYSFLINTWINAGVDPYEHLSKHLTSEQLKTAQELPNRSMAQVDYIISCVDRHSVCDDGLRKTAYALFKVNEISPPPLPLMR
jgi:hypothetical protein